ncbi:unnamed protein product [Microthlaspi erraticum]|uniref:Uncharacterized protein n=1 Tax=Microthlaspi erraticum TaxID=1685480 RepID=A0A6D2IV60_9BRAS|nr:unnamed protein product [Microthlaspi erraticum]
MVCEPEFGRIGLGVATGVVRLITTGSTRVPTWSLIELELVFTSTGIARMAVNWLTRESLGGLEVFLLGLSGPGLQSWIKVMGPYGLDSSGTRNMYPAPPF